LFCGAGGTSTGLIEACAELGYECELTAVNHWQIAVDTHSANHPKARHLCASLDSLNPRELYTEGELDILWASPECTHHSIARGGKPISDQSRATAWCVVRWAEALRPKIVLVENVKEFTTWGPIGSNGRPLASRKGEVFRSWVGNLEALGYRVEWRVLCAADYGDPTTRRRLFIQAVRGRRRVVWPEPSHGPTGEADLLGTRTHWVSARRGVIDWSIEGKSIFKRKRPLADKTLRRIEIGLHKFGLRPFIIPQQSYDERVRSVADPLQTITTESRGIGLVEPFVIGQQSGAAPRSVSDPLPTVAAAGAISLVQPFLVHLRGNCDAKSVEQPTPALTAGGGHLGLCQPYLVQTNHGNGKDKNGDERRVRDVSKPLPTVAGNRGEWSLCEPFVIAIDHHGGNGEPVHSADAPLSSVTTKQRHAVCEPFLVNYYGSSNATSLADPLDAVTTRDRFGLVQPVVEIDGARYLLDIRFRMLRPHELAAAQGFPRGYKFTGNTSQVVKQIGNAVPKNLAKALVKAALLQ
jgi:DNA (cytosine-5)-methyltransferase 1